jgi:hypothetical protein
MKNKGQVEGKVIIYVLGVFIASIILIFGYVVVDRFTSITYDIELLQFRQEVNQEVDRKLTEFRSKETLNLNLPSSFTEVCFAQTESSESSTSAQGQGFNLISYILKSSPPTPYNVFVLENKEIVEIFSVNKLSLSDNFKCFEIVDGEVTFTLVAKGREGVDIV